MDKKEKAKLEAMKAKAMQDKAFYEEIKKRNSGNMKKSQDDARNRAVDKAAMARDGKNSRNEGMSPRDMQMGSMKVPKGKYRNHAGIIKDIPDTPKPPKPKPKKPKAAVSPEKSAKLKKALEEIKKSKARSAARADAMRKGEFGRMHYK